MILLRFCRDFVVTYRCNLVILYYSVGIFAATEGVAFCSAFHFFVAEKYKITPIAVVTVSATGKAIQQ